MRPIHGFTKTLDVAGARMAPPPMVTDAVDAFTGPSGLRCSPSISAEGERRDLDLLAEMADRRGEGRSHTLDAGVGKPMSAQNSSASSSSVLRRRTTDDDSSVMGATSSSEACRQEKREPDPIAGAPAQPGARVRRLLDASRIRRTRSSQGRC